MRVLRVRRSVREVFNQFCDRVSYCLVFDSHEGLHKRNAISASAEFVEVFHRGATVMCHFGKGILEEVRRGHPENFRNLMQTAGTDAVLPFLVFLNLLKRNSQALS